MKYRRARGAIEKFVKQSRPHNSTRRAIRERRRLRLLESRLQQAFMDIPARIVMEIQPNTAPVSPVRHIDELQRNIKVLAGEYADLEHCPDAWLLLSVWDENWLELTNPNLYMPASELLSRHAEMHQIISLLGSYRAIGMKAAESMNVALSAVIESRAHAIFREYGQEGLTIHIIPNFSKAYAPDGVRHLH